MLRFASSAASSTRKTRPGPLGVLPFEVANALCVGMVVEAGVGSVTIVGVERLFVIGFAFGLAGVGARVGRFADKRLAETLELLLRLRTLRPGVPMFYLL